MKNMNMRVKIKTWEEMEQEFGLDEDGDIDTYYTFSIDMERLMPEDRIVNVLKLITQIFIWVPNNNGKWFITDDTIKEYISGEQK